MLLCPLSQGDVFSPKQLFGGDKGKAYKGPGARRFLGDISNHNHH